MRLTIVRHGETEENLKGIIRGHLPGKLTEKGKAQARKLAERLKDDKFDVIFSSDLARAADTAKEISKFHSEIPVYFIEELRERFMGDAQGKTLVDLAWEDHAKRKQLGEEWHAEDTLSITKRAKGFNEKLIDKFLGKNVLLVGHGAINAAIISDILRGDWFDFFKKNGSGNTAVTIFEFDDKKEPKLVLLNCTKHLED